MARKLTLGGSMMLCMCMALAGCQSGAGSRLASNKSNRGTPNTLAKQNSTPPPNFPTVNGNNNNNGFRNPAPVGANNGFAPSNPTPFGSPGVTPVGGNTINTNPPVPGPQNFPAAPNTTNRITQPDGLVLPPPVPSQPTLIDPGISKIQP